MPQKRGTDGHRVRPPHVTQAILKGDSHRLSQLGRAGAKASAEKRKQNKAERTEQQIKLALEELDREEQRKRKQELEQELHNHADSHRVAWDDDYRP